MADSILRRLDGVLDRQLGETKERDVLGSCNCNLGCWHVCIHGNCSSLAHPASCMVSLSSPCTALAIVSRGSSLAWLSGIHEYGRSFVDLKSQLLLQSLVPANYKDTWCDPSLALRNWDAAKTLTVESNQTVNVSDSNSSKLQSQYLYPPLVRASSRIDMLVRNFELVARIPGASVALLLLTICSLFMLSVSGSSTSARAAEFILRHRFRTMDLRPLPSA